MFKKIKEKFSFEFWQRFAKALMVVVAVMPAAGIAIGLGKLFTTMFGGIKVLAITGSLVESIGWVIIVNLPALFAVAIGGTWAKEKAGGAFAAFLAYLVMNQTIGTFSSSILGISTGELLTDANKYRDLFTSSLGFPTLQLGAIGGIACGFMGANLYNKYNAFDKLPNALSFFNGKRFVPIITLFWGAILGVIAVFVWPPVQTLINKMGIIIANPDSTLAPIAPFVYGTLERLLLPFGLHHMITIPINYSEVGGAYTSIFDGTVGAGQDLAFRVWVSDMIKAAGNFDLQNQIMKAYVPGRFKVGQIITGMGSLIGAGFAMLHVIPKEKRFKYTSMFLGAMGATFVAGVTEPIEFMFMFISPLLLGLHALLTGIAFMLPDILMAIFGQPVMNVHSFGLIEFILNGVVQVGFLSGHHLQWISVLAASGIFGLIYYGVFKYVIIKFNIMTPGRIDEEETVEDPKGKPAYQAEEKPLKVIEALGGLENLSEVDACMTRLRVTVKNHEKVRPDSFFKALGAAGVIKKEKGVQIIFGPEADVLKSKINLIREGN
ncbi:MAG: PTS transporter subunit EIIC [Fusobacteriaceae bacterium]|nr:PTS transporter subunit EIIC [Fusobacteriaceae bacterium]